MGALGQQSAEVNNGQSAEVAVNKPSSAPERASLANEAASSLTEEKLPSNEISDLYYDLKKSVEGNAESQGPLMDGILKLLKGLAKYMTYGDLLPGRFSYRLDADEKLAKEKFSDKDMEKIVNRKRDEANEKKVAGELKIKDEDVEKSSSNYICVAIMGTEPTDEASVLAARIKHSMKEVEPGSYAPYYRESNFKDLSTNGAPYGTIIFFQDQKRKGKKVSAFATGNGNEFQYFDPKNGGLVSFKLGAQDSPLKTDKALMVAFVPTFNSDSEYFAKHPDQINKQTDETKSGILANGSEKIDGTEYMTQAYLSDAKKSGIKTAELENYTKMAMSNLVEAQVIVEKLANKFINGEKNSAEDVVTLKSAMQKYINSLKASKEAFEIYKRKLVEEGKNDPEYDKAIAFIEAELKKTNQYIEKL